MTHENFEQANKAVADALRLVEKQRRLVALAARRKARDDFTEAQRRLNELRIDLAAAVQARNRVIIDIKKRGRSEDS